jgi:hypothetical protein
VTLCETNSLNRRIWPFKRPFLRFRESANWYILLPNVSLFEENTNGNQHHSNWTERLPEQNR